MANLTVKFDPTQFVRSHMEQPKGRGSWAFSLEERPADVVFSPSMTLADARKWMTARVRQMSDIPADVTTVWVNVLP
jgi:hypothetical protein